MTPPAPLHTAGTFSQTGIAVLAAKELYIVVALVEMEIEVAAALRAFQNAGEHAGLLGDGGLLAAGALLHAPHLLPGGPVDDGLMDIEEDCLPTFWTIGQKIFKYSIIPYLYPHFTIAGRT